MDCRLDLPHGLVFFDTGKHGCHIVNLELVRFDIQRHILRVGITVRSADVQAIGLRLN